MANFGACLALVSLGVAGCGWGGCGLWQSYCFTFVLVVVSCVWVCFMVFCDLAHGLRLFRGFGCCSVVSLPGFLWFDVGLDFVFACAMVVVVVLCCGGVAGWWCLLWFWGFGLRVLLAV